MLYEKYFSRFAPSVVIIITIIIIVIIIIAIARLDSCAAVLTIVNEGSGPVNGCTYKQYEQRKILALCIRTADMREPETKPLQLSSLLLLSFGGTVPVHCRSARPRMTFSCP